MKKTIKATAVCANCERLRVGDKWINRKATKEEYKVLGRVFCTACRPKIRRKKILSHIHA